MKTYRTLFTLVFIGFSVPALAQSAGNAEHGKQIYMNYGCYECHTTVGMGGGNAGPKIAPNPLPIEGIKAELRKPRALMPQYSEALVSDQDIADIHAFLMTIPAGPKAADIPMLNH